MGSRLILLRRQKIGGQTWRIYEVSPNSRHLHDGDEKLAGYCCYETKRIFIDTSLPNDVKEETLIHELLHALIDVCGLQTNLGGAEPEETFVKAITPLLHAVLQDLGFRLPR